MNLTALGPRVFVRPDAMPDMTADGLLHLVHEQSQSTMTGVVAAIGRDVREITVGDRVVFAPHHGEELVFDQDLIVCLDEGDILAVFTKE